ncbi:hypothetical protein SEA_TROGGLEHUMPER_31 [Rhodococcus phage Trogglehumper]|uniref:Uncharacterized protein n=1 Tax=Rhodococcus phage Trogglehumper TaxID=3038381 RepID=A0AAF0GK07_9CAUD|nr:hypothetical protein SEA_TROGGLEHUMPER_31 [Rhodococcus phage Trogglehumper]
MHPRTRKQLKCECSKRHLLAYYGLNEEGVPYVHVKAQRQRRIVVNLVILGDCEIQCPSCLRWVILSFKDDGEMDKEESLVPPAEIDEIQTLEYTNNA